MSPSKGKWKLDDRVYNGVYGEGTIVGEDKEGYTVRFDRNKMMVRPFEDKELGKIPKALVKPKKKK